MSEFLQFELQSVRDSRGELTVVQDVLPFDVRRIYWVTKADGETRGGHRHHVTRQALVAVAGCIEVYVNDGSHEAAVCLNAPSRCLLVEPEDWHRTRFGIGAVLLVMASHAYDPSDYITQPYDTDYRR